MTQRALQGEGPRTRELEREGGEVELQREEKIEK
jgi:hypothetical protein